MQNALTNHQPDCREDADSDKAILFETDESCRTPSDEE